MGDSKEAERYTGTDVAKNLAKGEIQAGQDGIEQSVTMLSAMGNYRLLTWL